MKLPSLRQNRLYPLRKYSYFRRIHSYIPLQISSLLKEIESISQKLISKGNRSQDDNGEVSSLKKRELSIFHLLTC